MWIMCQGLDVVECIESKCWESILLMQNRKSHKEEILEQPKINSKQDHWVEFMPHPLHSLFYKGACGEKILLQSILPITVIQQILLDPV